MTLCGGVALGSHGPPDLGVVGIQRLCGPQIHRCEIPLGGQGQIPGKILDAVVPMISRGKRNRYKLIVRLHNVRLNIQADRRHLIKYTLVGSIQ